MQMYQIKSTMFTTLQVQVYSHVINNILVKVTIDTQCICNLLYHILQHNDSHLVLIFLGVRAKFLEGS